LLAPTAGIRSNVIVGFPGEGEDDVQEVADFLEAADLDVVGVFGYSDEDGTEAADHDGKLDQDVIDDRVAHLTDLVEQLTADRAARRVGEDVDVLVESVDEEPGVFVGRTATQGPDIDGETRLTSGRRIGSESSCRPASSARQERISRPPRDESSPGAPGVQLEPAQCLDGGADSAGPGVCLGAAAARRH
jgi:tRNA A37 methylthiotransferase MiaB